jgi:hypothetical protein
LAERTITKVLERREIMDQRYEILEQILIPDSTQELIDAAGDPHGNERRLSAPVEP